jgi:hypothetical protein
MNGSSKRMLVLGLVLLTMTAACGDADAADPERFCEIDAEMDQLGDPFELPADETREVAQTARSLVDESVKVAPDEIRSSVEIQADSFEPFFELFEVADFDLAQIDEGEIDAMFETMFSGENDAAFEAIDEWIDANCSV